MWDYGGTQPITSELMQYQLDKYCECLKGGIVEGVISCTNCLADVGIAAVEQTREWVGRVGGERV